MQSKYGALLFVLLALENSLGLRADDDYEDEMGLQRKCEPITMSSCQAVGYNMTSMPNLVGMHNQRDAQYRLQSFTPLVQYGCSSQLQFFLCSLYAPMCTPQVPEPLGPCRPLCENVKRRCVPVLLEFGLTWPPALNCSQLPQENNDKHMCMEGPPETAPLPPSPIPPPRSTPYHGFKECLEFVHPQMYNYINATGRCAPICNANISFTSSDKNFALVWVAIWSVVTFVMCTFIALSLLIDPTVVKYPERSLVHMCVCYSAVSLGFIVRLSTGLSAISCIEREHLMPVAVTEGSIQASCAFVFLLLYYFSSAASVWWVMMCLSWLLRAWRHYTHEQLLRVSSSFHVVAWGVPALLTIACILLRRVAADELTGTCQVGPGGTLVRWQLVPQFAYLVSGATLVLVVFACLWKSHSRLRSDGVSTHRIDIAVARLGIISIIYMVPATCLIASSFYEYVEGPKWLRNQSIRPNMQVFMLKQFMTLAPGIFGSLFIANSRVISSWKNLFHRLITHKTLYLQPPASQGHSNPNKVPKTHSSKKLRQPNPLKEEAVKTKVKSSKHHHKKITNMPQHHHELMTPIVIPHNPQGHHHPQHLFNHYYHDPSIPCQVDHYRVYRNCPKNGSETKV